MKRYLVYLCTVALILTMFTDGRYTYRAIAASMYGPAANYVFSEEEEQWIAEARQELAKLLKKRTVMALVYLSDTYPVRVAPDYESAVVKEVQSGQSVCIQDVEMNSPFEVWAYVSFTCQGQQYTGYVPRTNLACSDEVFLEWENSYGMNPSSRALFTLGMERNTAYADVEQFPEDYQAALKALKEAHPNWIFVKMNTNLDWNEVVQNEMVRGRNLIPTSFPEDTWDGVHSPGWGYVTQKGLEYYLDPRNSLTESGIFQFEQLTYNESYHTEEALQTFLDDTFMAGIIPDTVLTYALTFFATGRELGVSPFHLACRVKQEQGAGNSALISGTYPGYEGYYNYFNIGASGQTTEEIIVSGLERAKKENWYNGYYSIYGGAKVISANYILQGQDTLYLQKFDVDDSHNGLYWHQYMQNVCAPTSEGKNVRKVYANAGALDNTFVFKIPVYNNMTAAPDETPEASYQVVLSVPEGYNDPTIYVDGIAYAAKPYEVSGGDVEAGNGDSGQVSGGDALPGGSSGSGAGEVSGGDVLGTGGSPGQVSGGDVIAGGSGDGSGGGSGGSSEGGTSEGAREEGNLYYVELTDGSASTAVMYQYNDKNVPVGMHVWELSHDGKTYLAKEVPELNDLLSYHGFSVRITGKSGIRFKTGIDAEVRKQLLSPEGAGGYTLKEYGTLVMNNANRDRYPLIKDGEKVLSGRSYGINESGVLEDKIYETVAGRHRFTSVLVGLPVSQYKTEFAFRGYAILTKDGKDVIIYGPTVWRSIYALSQQVLQLGQYPEGSAADLFLKKLISDADGESAQ